MGKMTAADDSGGRPGRLGRVRKALVLCVKLAVTGGVLWWVLSGVRWHDHVVTGDGRTLRAIEQRRDAVLVVDGADRRWRPKRQLQPVEGRLVRPGLAAAMADLRWPLYAVGGALLAAQLTLMGVRWWYLLRFQRIEASVSVAVRLMFVGHFFNFFLPGATGGDLLRAYLISKRTRRRTVAVATVLLDRFVGLAGMALLAGVMTLASGGGPQTRRAALAVGVTVAIILAAGLVLFSRTVGRAVRLDRLIDRLPRSENFRLAIRTLRDLPANGRAAATVAAMTVGVHLLLAAGIAAMGAALGLGRHVPLRHYFLFVPVIYILAAVPISIGGLGVVEGMYLVFFGQLPGVEGSPVLALALLARLTPMLLSLPGLVFWLIERGARPRAGEADLPGAGDAAVGDDSPGDRR